MYAYLANLRDSFWFSKQRGRGRTECDSVDYFEHDLGKTYSPAIAYSAKITTLRYVNRTRLFSDHWSLQNCSFYKETEERAEFWWIHAVGCFLGPAKRHQWQDVQ